MYVCMCVWLIRRQAAEVDGKAQNSLMKLQLFRQFYVMVVIYIYFTRIVVYLLTSTIPFYLLWMGPVRIICIRMYKTHFSMYAYICMYVGIYLCIKCFGEYVMYFTVS